MSMWVVCFHFRVSEFYFVFHYKFKVQGAPKNAPKKGGGKGGGKVGSGVQSTAQIEPSEIPIYDIEYVMTAAGSACAAIVSKRTDELAYQTSYSYDTETQNTMGSAIESEVTAMLTLLVTEAAEKIASGYSCINQVNLDNLSYESGWAMSGITADNTIASVVVGWNNATITLTNENDCTCAEQDFYDLLDGIIPEVRAKGTEINESLQANYGTAFFAFEE